MPDQASWVHRQGTVNRVYCKDIPLDTGSTKTLVRKELVAEQNMLGGETAVCCAHGDDVKYPMATIKVCIGGEDIQVQARVSDTLPAAVLIGWDVPQLMSLMSEKKDPERVLAVFTRSLKQIRDDSAEMAAETEPSLAVEENNVFNLDASLQVHRNSNYHNQKYEQTKRSTSVHTHRMPNIHRTMRLV